MITPQEHIGRPGHGLQFLTKKTWNHFQMTEWRKTWHNYNVFTYMLHNYVAFSWHYLQVEVHRMRCKVTPCIHHCGACWIHLIPYLGYLFNLLQSMVHRWLQMWKSSFFTLYINIPHKFSLNQTQSNIAYWNQSVTKVVYLKKITLSINYQVVLCLLNVLTTFGK